MSEKKKRVNYAYVNRRLTITGGLPAEILLYLLAGLFFLMTGMFTLCLIILIGGSVIATLAMRRGCTTITFILDFFRKFFSDNIHTIRSEATPKNPKKPETKS